MATTNDPNDLLAGLRRAEAEAEQTAKARYRTLVLDAAAGRINQARVSAELADLGKPTDVFAADLGRVMRRGELVDRIAAAREAEQQQAEVAAQLELAEAEFAEVQAKFEREKGQPLHAELERLRWVQSSGREARQELRRDAGRNLVAAADELVSQRNQLAARVGQLSTALASWRPAAERGDRQALKQVQNLEPQLAEAEARYADVMRRAAEAESAVLMAFPPDLLTAGEPAGSTAGPIGKWSV